MNSIMIQYWGTVMFPNFVIVKQYCFWNQHRILLDNVGWCYYLDFKEDFLWTFQLMKK